MRSAAGRPPGRVHVAISMFSATVRSAKIPLSSGAQPTPSRAISCVRRPWMGWPRNSTPPARGRRYPMIVRRVVVFPAPRSEEHTSELQSQSNLVCRLLLEKKNSMLLPAADALQNDDHVPWQVNVVRFHVGIPRL